MDDGAKAAPVPQENEVPAAETCEESQQASPGEDSAASVEDVTNGVAEVQLTGMDLPPWEMHTSESLVFLFMELTGGKVSFGIGPNRFSFVELNLFQFLKNL